MSVREHGPRILVRRRKINPPPHHLTAIATPGSEDHASAEANRERQ